MTKKKEKQCVKQVIDNKFEKKNSYQQKTVFLLKRNTSLVVDNKTDAFVVDNSFSLQIGENINILMSFHTF